MLPSASRRRSLQPILHASELHVCSGVLPCLQGSAQSWFTEPCSSATLTLHVSPSRTQLPEGPGHFLPIGLCLSFSHSQNALSSTLTWPSGLLRVTSSGSLPGALRTGQVPSCVTALHGRPPSPERSPENQPIGGFGDSAWVDGARPDLQTEPTRNSHLWSESWSGTLLSLPKLRLTCSLHLILYKLVIGGEGREDSLQVSSKLISHPPYVTQATAPIGTSANLSEPYNGRLCCGPRVRISSFSPPTASRINTAVAPSFIVKLRKQAWEVEWLAQDCPGVRGKAHCGSQTDAKSPRPSPVHRAGQHKAWA